MALKFGPALLIIISSISIFLGVTLFAINIDENKYRNPPATHFAPDVVIDNKPTDLVWFLQITDLHLSVAGNLERQTEFEDFAVNYTKYIQPDAILVTGDITDGRVPNTTFGSGPQLGEWQAYSKAVQASLQINKNVPWLDIRGNHDNFNVYRPQDPQNLYRQYSVQGKKHSRNYRYTLTKDNKRYTFIGVDEVQTPGLKMPINFLGIVKDEDFKELLDFKEKAEQDKSQYTVWFAHYPTASIATPSGEFRDIIDGPYLCGHYHTIGNFVPQMFSTQQPGYAELELGDWKNNRRLRLASIDHQLFNFIDLGYNEFPIALMTNPKRPECSMPKYEPVDRIARSTHIRVIAFSNTRVAKVEISIDDDSQRSEMQHVSGPLYVLPWTTSKYSSGLHTAHIFVEDINGASKLFNQTFSLDNSQEGFSFGAKLLIRLPMRDAVAALFYSVVFMCTIPLSFLRLLSQRCGLTRINRHYKGTFIFKFHLLANIRRLFLPLYVLPIWVMLGPLFVGRLVDDVIGVCFVWGIFVDGTFIHTGLTFNIASLYLLLVHVPELLLLTYQVGASYASLAKEGSMTASVINVRLLTHIILTALQITMCCFAYSGYGIMAALTSVPFFLSTFVYSFCWYQCTTIIKQDFIKFALPTSAEEQQGLTECDRSTSGV